MTSLKVRNLYAPPLSQVTSIGAAHQPTLFCCRMKATVSWYKIIAERTARRQLPIFYDGAVCYSDRAHAAFFRLETIRVDVIKTFEPTTDTLPLKCDVTRAHQPTRLWRHQVVN